MASQAKLLAPSRQPKRDPRLTHNLMLWDSHLKSICPHQLNLKPLVLILTLRVLYRRLLTLRRLKVLFLRHG